MLYNTPREFYAFASVSTDSAQLQGALTITRLPDFCASIDEVFADHGDNGEMYRLWGPFVVNREPIRGGVRFSLPGCPNALAWTVAVNLVLFSCTPIEAHRKHPLFNLRHNALKS